MMLPSCGSSLFNLDVFLRFNAEAEAHGALYELTAEPGARKRSVRCDDSDGVSLFTANQFQNLCTRRHSLGYLNSKGTT